MIKTPTAKLNRSLVNAIQHGRNLILKVNSLEEISDNIFEQVSVAAFLLSLILFCDCFVHFPAHALIHP